MMLRAVRLALVVVLVGALAPPASSAAQPERKSRTETAEYVVGVAGYVARCDADPVGCAWFEVKPGERFISLEIADATGQPVYASVYTYGYSDGSDSHEHICGRSKQPLRMSSHVDHVAVVIDAYGATDDCPSAGTNGTITATFSNRRPRL